MRKSVLLICGIISICADKCLFAEPVVWGPDTELEGCYSWDCLEPSKWYSIAGPDHRNCKDYTAMCVNISGVDFGVASCSTCDYGYELKEGNAGITACAVDESDDAGGGVNSYRYSYCYKNCQASNCTSDAYWRAGSTGYEVRTARSCSETGTNGECNGAPEYRCAENYYGSSTDGKNGCEPCPQWMGVYSDDGLVTRVVGKSNAGSTTIADCFVKQNTYYDSFGTFETDGDCIGQ